MLAEKRSFYYFLFIYIFSTFFLFGIGGYFYYKLSYQNIINKTTLTIRNNIGKFIANNMEKHFIRTGKEPDYGDLKVSVYIDKKYFLGNINPPKEIDLDKLYEVKNNTICYIHTTKKRWGVLSFVSCKNITESISKLKKKLFIFSLFALIFIIIVAYLLGKLFLRPLRETLQNLEEFITDATHEINTPISNIVTNTEMLKELQPELKDNEELRRIESASNRLSKIFRDLSFVKLNHKKIRKINQIEADKVLKERISFLDTQVQMQSLFIKSNIEPLSLDIDKEDLTRLIDNLLSNAIKYAPPKTTVSIRLHDNLLEISNKGKLMTDKNLIKKFIRADKTEGGFGIGLHIVQKICNFYGYKFHLKQKGETISAKIHFC